MDGKEAMMIESKRERYIRLLSGLTDMGATLTANATAEVVELLKEPVMDAVPVRHGRWTIEDCHAATYRYCCSNCTAHHRARYAYCPSCGEMMDGKGGEQHG